MSEIYKLLQDIIETKKISVAEAARLCDLPDSTVRGIITRKQNSIALDVAFKLSHGLGVSIEYLNGDDNENKLLENKKQPPSKDESATFYDNSLSENENYLVNAYRGMNKSGQKALVSSAASLYDIFKSIDTVPNVG